MYSMETVRIFDGEETHDIGIEYFFQNPVVESINKHNVAHYYKATLIYKLTLRDVINMVGIDTDHSVVKSRIKELSQVGKGLHMIKIMIHDILGDKTAASVIEVIENIINQELYEES